VQCSSYSGQCSGQPDRLICDGQTVMCPGSVTPDQPNQPDLANASSQKDQQCEGRHPDRRHRRHGQTKRDVSCGSASAAP
jgi:hypothetical protein